MASHWAILSMGSNLEDPLNKCCRAVAALEADNQIELQRRSPFYWTEPVDFTAQQWFLNAALKVRTALSPSALLSKLQAIQTTMGRKQGGVRYGPREIDLDIILYEDMILNGDELTIPHPRMHKRRFVLQPICDIEPEIRHPVLGVTMFQLLNQLDKDDQKIRPCYSDC